MHAEARALAYVSFTDQRAGDGFTACDEGSQHTHTQCENGIKEFKSADTCARRRTTGTAAVNKGSKIHTFNSRGQVSVRAEKTPLLNKDEHHTPMGCR